MTVSISYKTLNRAIWSIAIFYHQWQQPEYIEKRIPHENNLCIWLKNYKTKNAVSKWNL